jgi:hypothetical protein
VESRTFQMRLLGQRMKIAPPSAWLTVPVGRSPLLTILGMMFWAWVPAVKTFALESESPETIAIPDGQWSGTVSWMATAPISKSMGVANIRIEVCEGYVEVFLSDPGDAEVRVTIGYNVVAGPDLYMLYRLTTADFDDPHWVEVHSYTLALREGDTADVTWTRTVNNRLSDATDPVRTFSQFGRGKATRTASSCDSKEGSRPQSEGRAPSQVPT